MAKLLIISNNTCNCQIKQLVLCLGKKNNEADQKINNAYVYIVVRSAQWSFEQ